MKIVYPAIVNSPMKRVILSVKEILAATMNKKTNRIDLEVNKEQN